MFFSCVGLFTQFVCAAAIYKGAGALAYNALGGDAVHAEPYASNEEPSLLALRPGIKVAIANTLLRVPG